MIEVLIDFEDDEAEKAVAWQEAKSIRLQLERFENTFMLILWNFLRSQFNAVNRKLQAVETWIVEDIEYYTGLKKIVLDCRNDWSFGETSTRAVRV